jgi:hypothetical protein
VYVFKRNGVVLWSKQLAAIKGTFIGGSIINQLIRTVLLEEKTGMSQVRGAPLITDPPPNVR